MPSRTTRTPRKRRSSGRPAADQVEQRIEILLDVAATVFVEKGYEGTTVEEIARRANASKQTLYTRYPSKAELFTAVMSRLCQAGFKRVADILRPEEPLGPALRKYAWELIRPLVDKDLLSLNRTIICASERFPELGRMFWSIGPERAHRVLSEFVKNRIATGELCNGDPDQVADLFLAMCSGRYWAQGLLAFRRPPTRSEINQYIDRVVESFVIVHASKMSQRLALKDGCR